MVIKYRPNQIQSQTNAPVLGNANAGADSFGGRQVGADRQHAKDIIEHGKALGNVGDAFAAKAKRDKIREDAKAKVNGDAAYIRIERRFMKEQSEVDAVEGIARTNLIRDYAGGYKKITEEETKNLPEGIKQEVINKANSLSNQHYRYIYKAENSGILDENNKNLDNSIEIYTTNYVDGKDIVFNKEGLKRAVAGRYKGSTPKERGVIYAEALSNAKISRATVLYGQSPSVGHAYLLKEGADIKPEERVKLDNIMKKGVLESESKTAGIFIARNYDTDAERNAALLEIKEPDKRAKTREYMNSTVKVAKIQHKTFLDNDLEAQSQKIMSDPMYKISNIYIDESNKMQVLPYEYQKKLIDRQKSFRAEKLENNGTKYKTIETLVLKTKLENDILEGKDVDVFSYSAELGYKNTEGLVKFKRSKDNSVERRAATYFKTNTGKLPRNPSDSTINDRALLNETYNNIVNSIGASDDKGFREALKSANGSVLYVDKGNKGSTSTGKMYKATEHGLAVIGRDARVEEIEAYGFTDVEIKPIKTRSSVTNLPMWKERYIAEKDGKRYILYPDAKAKGGYRAEVYR